MKVQQKSSKVRGFVNAVRASSRPTGRQAGTIALLLVIILLVLWRVVGLIGELREVRAARADLEGKRAMLEERHKDLEQEAQFVSNPDNLEQELRTRYNYKKPGESVIIVVPPKDASSTTSTHE